ncbi:MAG: hypothetical protein GY755_06865 [Chloroflexi bacterium]|nr:hypothetical protein [Chloroflexota bacterium]
MEQSSQIMISDGSNVCAITLFSVCRKIELKELTLKTDDLSGSELQPGQYIRLTIADNGIGMSQGIINKIFEPYLTTKEQGKGTGLHLAVVYGIIK